jgi:NADH:ubiquinone oxidoreductase subunit 6 (subunit J)
MESVFEILKIIIPAGAVFATAYFLIRTFLNNENKRRELEIRKSSLTIVAPIRLQAYERIVIFLERLHPNNLVLACKQGRHDLPSVTR